MADKLEKKIEKLVQTEFVQNQVTSLAFCDLDKQEIENAIKDVIWFVLNSEVNGGDDYAEM